MRKSRQEAAKTRVRIIASAAAEFREHGITATGLADFMKAAGLTHGGFYRHFDSKDQLVAEACATAAATMTARVVASASNGREGDGLGGGGRRLSLGETPGQRGRVAFFKQMPHRVAPRLAGSTGHQ